jgi:hypothetical protein
MRKFLSLENVDEKLGLKRCQVNINKEDLGNHYIWSVYDNVMKNINKQLILFGLRIEY